MGIIKLEDCWPRLPSIQTVSLRGDLRSIQELKGGVPWWLSGLRIWQCHCYGSGHCCGRGLISGPRVHPKKKKRIKMIGFGNLNNSERERKGEGRVKNDDQVSSLGNWMPPWK